MVFLGFDPGGVKRFGWAALQVSKSGVVVSLTTGITSSALEAVRQVANSVPSEPLGVGIDAPLFWVQEGDRRADAYIRKRVVAAGGQSGTVSSVNSLRGACLVQGVLAARIVATSWPAAIITEAHPKALLRLDEESKRFADTQVDIAAEEHERDAALAAYSAWSAVSKRLSWRNLLADEVAPFFPGGREVTYWFPGERD